MAEATGKRFWEGETGSWGFLPSGSWLQSRRKFHLSPRCLFWRSSNWRPSLRASQLSPEGPSELYSAWAQGTGKKGQGTPPGLGARD